MLKGLKQTGVILATPVVMVATVACAPVLIWTAAVVNCRQAIVERRARRKLSPAGEFACRLDDDCPPGYYCQDGRCVPVAAD